MKSARIRSSAAALKQAPDEKSETADEALCGMRVDVLEDGGEWLRVRTDYLYEGWVSGHDLCVGDEVLQRWSSMPQKLVWQACADVLDVPKVQGRIVAGLYRGSLLGVTEESQNGYRKVNLCDGRMGWIWENFLTDPPSDWKRKEPKELRGALVQTACLYLGVQYRWGGKTPLGIDCSGLCSMAYLLNGIKICRDSHILPEFPMREIRLDRVEAGDLLFFPGHVAMYMGNGRYIHSTAGNNCHGVVVNSLDPGAPDYRGDLPKKLLCCGSIFV